jgi:uncharacterized SAM-binding protein YcdF (DUF218 family)
MLRRLALVIGGLLAVYLAGFVLFVATLPSKPSARLKADGIVALTGGDMRLDAAVALLEGGIGKRLLITGANKVLTKEHMKELANGGARFDCCADMGYMAEDTYGNAEEASEWATRHRFRSLIVVTANYHMPRSMRFFRSVMPKMRLIAYPVEPQAAWWHLGMLHLLHNEYLKYIAALAVTAVDRGPPDGKSRGTS